MFFRSFYIIVLTGIKYYGENYDAISEIIGTKTVQHIKAIIEARKSELKIDEVILICLFVL